MGISVITHHASSNRRDIVLQQQLTMRLIMHKLYNDSSNKYVLAQLWAVLSYKESRQAAGGGRTPNPACDGILVSRT